MSSNKSAKQKLIQRYGSIDFLDELKIKIPECKHYKSKGQLQKMKELTYHHIREKSKGGKATTENGALLTVEHHVWFHQQAREVQDYLNENFQELKRRKDQGQEVQVVFIDEDIKAPFTINFMELGIDKKGKIKAYNRSKKKRNDKKMIDEYNKEKENDKDAK